MNRQDPEDWTALLTAAGRRLERARSIEAHAKTAAAKLAQEAIAAGISERSAAELLGVNRMSLRDWLGKNRP